MPLVDEAVTVEDVIRALTDDVDPSTPVVIAIAGTDKLLWPTQITLAELTKRYQVGDEAIELAPQTYVVIEVTATLKPRGISHGRSK